MNMQAIMRQAQQMQSEIMKIQRELEKTEYEGNSSLVTVVLNGKKEMLKLTIKDKEKDSLGFVKVDKELVTCNQYSLEDLAEDVVLLASNGMDLNSTEHLSKS